MPWWMESDTFADDPRWEALGQGAADRVDQLQALYCRLKSTAAHLLTDGYLTRETALRYARGRRQLLDRLTVAVLDQPPYLHTPGDKCDCLDDWIGGYAYRIHRFLRRNPSRAEHARHRAQRADLRDARLKTAVLARDGGCCRYCRSGPLSARAGRARDRRKVLTFDHVDPDRPAGIKGSNLVVSCARCNEFKGHRTPDEADMVLLPEPTVEERNAWSARTAPVLNDLPDDEQKQKQNNDERSSRRRTDDRHNDRSSLLAVGHPDRHPGDESTGPVRPQDADQRPEQRHVRSGKGAGLGRGGSVVLDVRPGPAQPSRTPADPDPYHRRSRAPDLPPHRWPPGSVPATAPEDDHDL